MKVIKGYSKYKIDDGGNVWHRRLNRKLAYVLRDKYPRVHLWNDETKTRNWVQVSKLMKNNILSVPAHLIGVPELLLIVKYKNGNQSDCSRDNLQLELSKNRRWSYCNRCYSFHKEASKGGLCI